MPKSNVETIGFRKENYPKVLAVANELADVLDRSAHDSIRKLILGAGRAKINKLRSERAKELGIPAVQEQAAPVGEGPSSIEGKEQDTESSPESQ